MKHVHTFLLVGIIIIAAILRLWQIGMVPASPDWDEVALGYSAYSILETGKDEYGRTLPFVLKSFGDYKPALYAYFIIPFIPLFDLSIISIRLPSILFGIVTVITTYFLVLELFKKKGHALAAAFFLALSPWHIQFSRVGFEANVGVALNVLTALCFLKGMRKPWYLLFSALFAGMNVYTYQSEKLFVPLFLAILVVVYHKTLMRLPSKHIFGALGLLILLILPMFLFTLFSSEGLARAKSTSLFTKESKELQAFKKRIEKNKRQGDVIAPLFDNTAVFYTRQIMDGYLKHYDLNWLFIEGDIPRHHAPAMGLLYLWELPFLLLGIYIVAGIWLPQTKDKKPYLFLILWFLAAPLPAAITTDVPHAVRTMNFLPTFQVFIAVGVIAAIHFLREEVKKPLLTYTVSGFMILLLLFNVVYYLNQYFVQLNYFTAPEWQYGYKQLVNEVEVVKGQYDNVIISSISPMDQSYMFFLFYKKYPPKQFQVETLRTGTNNFDDYEFRQLNWEQDKHMKNTLFIGAPTQFPPDAPVIQTITYPNGEPAMQLVAPY